MTNEKQSCSDVNYPAGTEIMEITIQIGQLKLWKQRLSIVEMVLKYYYNTISKKEQLVEWTQNIKEIATC